MQWSQYDSARSEYDPAWSERPLTEPVTSGAPRVIGARGDRLDFRSGSDVTLPCRGQAFPVPFFRYVRTGYRDPPVLVPQDIK